VIVVMRMLGLLYIGMGRIAWHFELIQVKP